MPSLKHTHTYVRRTGRQSLPYESTFKCADPKCTHFDLAINVKDKESLCSKCGQKKIIMTFEQLRLARPRCDECAASRRSKKRVEISKILEGELNI